jgi:hypothetical protein
MPSFAATESEIRTSISRGTSARLSMPGQRFFRGRRDRSHFPLHPGHSDLAGLVELVPFMQDGDVRGLLHEKMRPLSEENLISADASIVSFIRGADRQPCRLIVSGSEISGLVSLSEAVASASCSFRHGNPLGDDHGRFYSQRVRRGRGLVPSIASWSPGKNPQQSCRSEDARRIC